MTKAVIYKMLCCIFGLVGIYFSSYSQNDTAKKVVTIDTLKKIPAREKITVFDSLSKIYSPRKAAIRSAMLPGWGQVYNKKYWKLPIVYGALGITGGVFFYNLNTYRDLRFAFKAKFLAETTRDSSLLPLVKRKYLVFPSSDLRYYRDEYRRNIDYSALFFILFWGLNVVDAAVDAHLKSFDVSPDLSFKIKTGYSDVAGTNGLSVILTFK